MKRSFLLVILLLWLNPRVSSAIPQQHSGTGPNRPAATPRPGPVTASWTNRQTWNGRPSPFRPSPANAGRAVFVELLEQNAGLLDQALRLLDDWTRDPVRNSHALNEAFGDFLIYHDPSSVSLSGRLGDIARETNPSARATESEWLRQALRQSLLGYFFRQLQQARAAGANPQDLLQSGFSDLTRRVARETDDAIAASLREHNLGFIRERLAPLSVSVLDGLGSLSHSDLNQLASLASSDVSSARELLLNPQGFSVERLHQLSAQSRGAGSPSPPSPIPPFHTGLPIVNRLSNLRTSIASFENAYRTLMDLRITRGALALRYDEFMRQATRRSLTDHFRDRHLDSDVRASVDDLFLVVSTMKEQLRQWLMADRGPAPSEPGELNSFRRFNQLADEMTDRLRYYFPQWGAPSTYAGRRTAPLGPAGISPVETDDANQERARSVAQGLRERGASDREAALAERRILDGYAFNSRFARAQNDAARAANQDIFRWAFAYTSDPGITRARLAEIFDSFYAAHFRDAGATLTEEWRGLDMSAPATAQELTLINEVLSQSRTETDRAILTSREQWGIRL